ncbi:hypothetical protein PENARI_c041G02434 [Penicillium arizonense]|uniref:Uncharacterized protein n=1 Tax=Penicillium arizonense TaxID=1835702 RepID=A0A1F5L2Z1_PENAI|nr:hypothetical protein PENARI_c041G02434 [Penicillium arizonense]OGE47583.1 hypothetical protein PENARI_c041G02434 [Penicillium arizonense]
MARRFEAGALPNLGAPVRPEWSAKPIFAPAYLESLNPSHVSTFSHSTPKCPMMEAIADDLPDNDVNGDISSSRDQDAKAEQRRQQNRRNAQGWRASSGVPGWGGYPGKFATYGLTTEAATSSMTGLLSLCPPPG